MAGTGHSPRIDGIASHRTASHRFHPHTHDVIQHHKTRHHTHSTPHANTCAHACTPAHSHECKHSWHAHTRRNTCAHAHMHSLYYVVRTRVCVQASTHASKHARTHARTHARLHAHMRACTRVGMAVSVGLVSTSLRSLLVIVAIGVGAAEGTLFAVWYTPSAPYGRRPPMAVAFGCCDRWVAWRREGQSLCVVVGDLSTGRSKASLDPHRRAENGLPPEIGPASLPSVPCRGGAATSCRAMPQCLLCCVSHCQRLRYQAAKSQNVLVA